VSLIRRRLLPAPARRLLSEAGPPNSWVVAGFVVVALVSTVMYAQQVSAVVIALVAAAIVTVPALLDADGWRIRLGMAWLSAEQRRRMGPDLPRTRGDAERWLARPDASEATYLRASMLMTAGRLEEAGAVIAAAQLETPGDLARALRFEAALDGLRTGAVDPTAAAAAIAALPPADLRYHELSLAWSIAWVAASSHRPWRRTFAEAARGVDRHEIPRRWLIGLSVQQLLATVVAAATCLVLIVLGWR
jgi:hypothetical protein